ncbi:MAG: hypothetical protein RI955_2021 [Bacteroidota bacterium]
MTKKIILFLLLLLLIAANTQAKYFLFKKKYMRHYEWIKLTPKTIEPKIPTPKKGSIADTTIENKDEDIQPQKNKLGRLQSALDTADEEIVASNKIIDTSKRTIDSIQKVEIKKIVKFSKLSNIAIIATLAGTGTLLSTRKNEPLHDNNIQDFFTQCFAFIGLIAISYCLVSAYESKKVLKKGWKKLLNKWDKINYKLANIIFKITGVILSLLNIYGYIFFISLYILAPILVLIIVM